MSPDIAIVGTSSQSTTEDVSQENMRLSSGSNGSESLRRSRRKMTRVRRLVSEEPNSPPPEKAVSENPKKTPARKRSRVSEEKGQISKKNDTSAVIVEDISSPLPPAKRTRSKAVSRTSGGVEGGMVMGGVCDHPLEWGVTEVSEFIKGIPQCAGLVGVFQEHVSGRVVSAKGDNIRMWSFVVMYNVMYILYMGKNSSLVHIILHLLFSSPSPLPLNSPFPPSPSTLLSGGGWGESSLSGSTDDGEADGPQDWSCSTHKFCV